MKILTWFQNRCNIGSFPASWENSSRITFMNKLHKKCGHANRWSFDDFVGMGSTPTALWLFNLQVISEISCRFTSARCITRTSVLVYDKGQISVNGRSLTDLWATERKSCLQVRLTSIKEWPSFECEERYLNWFHNLEEFFFESDPRYCYFVIAINLLWQCL